MTDTGILAAKNARMTVVAFTNGNSEHDFEIAEHKIENFDDNEIKFL